MFIKQLHQAVEAISRLSSKGDQPNTSEPLVETEERCCRYIAIAIFDIIKEMNIEIYGMA